MTAFAKKSPLFCWSCGQNLTLRDGAPLFVTVDVGGNPVKVHPSCEAVSIAYLKYDTTPRDIYERMAIQKRARVAAEEARLGAKAERMRKKRRG